MMSASAARSLKRVRELRSLALSDVATFTKISKVRLGEFEEGTRKPSHLQLNKLAAVYGVQPFAFFDQNLRNLPELIPDFRSAKPTSARLSPAALCRLWTSEKRSQFTAQILEEVDYAAPSWAKDVPKGDGEASHAEELRAFFDDWLKKRRQSFGFQGPEEQVFMQAFRLFMEVRGLVINVNDAPAEDYLGFYVRPDEGVPLAFVNRTILSKKAQLFTLVHEVCHHLVKLEGISDPFVAKNAVERKCNRFAAHFLAPTKHFGELATSLRKSSDAFELIRNVSRASLLSHHATAIRLVEAGFIRQPDVMRWRAKSPRLSRSEKDEDASTGRGQPHAKRLGELGYLPVYAASLAIKEQLVDAIDVREGISLSEALQEKAFDLAKRRVKVALEK